MRYFLLATLAFGGLMYLLVASALQEEREWREFKESHNCVLVEKIQSEISYGITAEGKFGTVITPEQDGWKCNDGITYYQ